MQNQSYDIGTNKQGEPTKIFKQVGAGRSHRLMEVALLRRAKRNARTEERLRERGLLPPLVTIVDLEGSFIGDAFYEKAEKLGFSVVPVDAEAVAQ
jgi:hypothetical protein